MTELRFVDHPSGLHFFQRPDRDWGATFVLTLDENMKMFTKRQVESASKARELYEMLQCPSKNDFDIALQTSAIKGC